MDAATPRPKPTEKQLAFMDWEQGLFLHFGIRTFYEGVKDWDGSDMDAAAFMPSELSCSQWMEAASEAGFNYAVLTAKHHDGFALWPTRYSGYSVANSPWKDGQGDVVREFIEACHQHGVKPGLYYSPAEPSLLKAEWSADDYDEYFLNQVSELLANYGPIEIIWFDGCGSEEHEYDWERIIGEIRRMQPGIRIFNMGDPDIRWIGNEAGIAPLRNWNEVDSLPYSIRTDKKEQVANDGGVLWLPGECDFRMRQENWFYSDSDEETVKSLDELMGLYYYSVGRGANLLLNIGPDRRGLLPDKDTARLLEFGREIRGRFARPFARGADFAHTELQYSFSKPEPFLLNHVILSENLMEGQAVTGFGIYIKANSYMPPICVYEGKTIGHKAICVFPTVSAYEVTVEITDYVHACKMEDIQLFYIVGGQA
ncbi:alpha-L-fucosidase [Cohnella fermenti]|uniref:alpha-L-fucosidase n=1 Tax=Cohnella fermenti TaxID=2565925 RepID=A0A4V3WEK5_9BACL|nr:alpha-L-fucosidase [Cohnella fermenti]THF76715.1 hypothetical protein E6C55_18260 [Cohnella fermenti]